MDRSRATASLHSVFWVERRITSVFDAGDGATKGMCASSTDWADAQGTTLTPHVLR